MASDTRPAESGFLLSKNMAKLSEQTIERWRNILREDFGKEFTFEEAGVMLSDLVGFFDTLARLKHEEEVEVPELPVESQAIQGL